ncbi:MAG: rod shape-determining protein [Patescibacteria group bacterium]|nr:rod shape-determining protein [Patescibacteria group bacterium]
MINNFFSLFSHDIGIDLGTANTLVWVKEKGIIIREPSVVAIHKKTKNVIAIGLEAKKMVGKTPATLMTIYPLKDGVISDFDATLAMISKYIQQIHEVGSFMPRAFARPKVVIGIPSSVTEVERRAVWEAALAAGARQAYLIEEPMAAAVGEGISVFQPTGAMIVDIGGGTTEIAIISLGGIVVGRSLKIAGREMDEAIAHYIRLRHGVLLGESTVEELKIKIGSAYKKSSKFKVQSSKLKNEENEEKEEIKTEEVKGEKMAIVRGRDIETGLPKSIRITEIEVREALSGILSKIIEEIVDTLESAPPDLTSDILEHGILLTGGGSILEGFDHLIVERTRMPVVCSSDPLTSVVRGIGKVLEDELMLDRIKVTGGLR